MANIAGLDSSKVYFHGVDDNNVKWKLRKPSIKTPMYLTDSYDEASTYCDDMEQEIVYLVTIKDGVKAFNFAKDVDRLKGNTFYADDTIDLLRICYEQKPDFNLWKWTHRDEIHIKEILMEMETAIKIVSNNNDLKFDVFAMGSPFYYVIHHYSAGGNIHKITPEIREECKEMFQLCKDGGFQTVHDAVFSMCEDARDEATLVMMMYCDIIDAMAMGTYYFNFMTFRRPLYEAILQMGYTIICDSNSTGRSANEYVLLSPDPIDRILNTPISPENERKYEVIADMRWTLKKADSMTKKNLLLFLDSSEEKL